ncbi:MAG TPA: methionyl-tRNA formyltransferase [Polyangiaceae bacterium]|jgi:methionyl-tRNA formyltransferase|nr:methionyl-tRNA formyltransferase [Polyangiaceae bacterium]
MNGKPAPPRAVFFGTPPIAVPSLEALRKVAEVVGVVTQPDRPAGRGLSLQVPAVKARALELGLEVTQPVKVRDGALLAWLRERRPDVLVVLAYGRILPRDILELAPHGAINLHASLLPRHRGAAPIAWAIIEGDAETGISLMQMDEGMDTGAVLSRHPVRIGETETAGELTTRLGELAARVLREDLPRALAGELTPEPQDAALATSAPPLTREHGRVDFGKPARTIANLVRGLSPRPGAVTSVGGKMLRLTAVRADPHDLAGPTGSVRLVDGAPWVVTREGSLEIVRAQLEGRREVSGRDLVNGRVLLASLELGA